MLSDLVCTRLLGLRLGDPAVMRACRSQLYVGVLEEACQGIAGAAP